MAAPREFNDKVSDFGAHRAAAVARSLGRDSATTAVISLVAAQRGASIAQLLHPRRGLAGIALTRQLAMYLTHTMLGLSLTEVGALFGRDRTTVSHACALIEDQRDDAAFDEAIGRLELAIERLAGEEIAAPREVRHGRR
jgi:chromosomal replication initiation ATPase DnaA